MKKILITFSEGGENGGPYISHQRIIESSLKNLYVLEPFFFPRIRHLINPIEFIRYVVQIRKSKADAMLVAGLQVTGFLLALLCKCSGIKVILAVHGSLTENNCSKLEKKVYEIIERLTIRMADIIYGVSDYVSSWKYFKNCSRYFGTIYNMVEKKQEKSIDWRVKLGIKKDDIVVVSTGRIVKEKGFDVLWNSIKKIGHTSNIKYIIVGSGNYLECWKKEIKENKFDNEVFLVGYQKNVNAILECANIFIICTKHETLCISLLEAAAKKLPLIATNIGGIPEIIDETCGFLVSLNDVEGFADAIKKMVGNSSMRIEMGKNACEKIQKKFANEIIEEKLNIIFSGV